MVAELGTRPWCGGDPEQQHGQQDHAILLSKVAMYDFRTLCKGIMHFSCWKRAEHSMQAGPVLGETLTSLSSWSLVGMLPPAHVEQVLHLHFIAPFITFIPL